MLDAGKGMQRLGLYPKTPARPRAPAARTSLRCSPSLWTWSSKAGLFQDIEQAIASPGTDVDKSMGDYVTHRDYTTSREINV